MSSALPIPPEYSLNQKIQHEIELFGFPLSKHPLELYAKTFQGLNYVSACKIHRHVGQTITVIGWMITEKSVWTKEGEPMEFVTFEDLTGMYEATFFPKAYRKFGHLLTSQGPYILEGIVEEEFQTHTLVVKNIRTPLINTPSHSPIFHQDDVRKNSFCE